MCGDGQLVNDMKYRVCPQRGFGDEDTVRVTLQWVWDRKLRCELLFGNSFAFELDAAKSYRFAVAMKDRMHYLQWKSFTKYNDVIAIHGPHSTSRS